MEGNIKFLNSTAPARGVSKSSSQRTDAGQSGAKTPRRGTCHWFSLVHVIQKKKTLSENQIAVLKKSNICLQLFGILGDVIKYIKMRE